MNKEFKNFIDRLEKSKILSEPMRLKRGIILGIEQLERI